MEVALHRTEGLLFRQPLDQQSLHVGYVALQLRRQLVDVVVGCLTAWQHQSSCYGCPEIVLDISVCSVCNHDPVPAAE